MSDLVAGYREATCGHGLILEVIAQRTGGPCPDCFVADGGRRLARLEIVGRGVRYQASTGRSRSKPKRPATPERRARKRASERAGERARKRLAAAMPELYEMFLADERAAAGLDPWPLDVALRHRGDGGVEAGFAEMLRELEAVS